MECPNCKTEIVEGLAVCSQCKHSLKKEIPALKTYWLATLSFLCFSAVIVFCIAAILSSIIDIEMNPIIEKFVPFFALVLLAASPILGILALLKINRSNSVLGGKSRAIFVIGVSSLFLAMTAPSLPMSKVKDMALRLVCGERLSALGTAITVYANDHDGKVPALESWCDLLITEANVLPEQFICKASDTQYGESSYALNKNIAGMKLSDLQPETVLLFEAKCEKESSYRNFPLKSRGFAAHLDNSNIREHQSDKVDKFRWNQFGSLDLIGVDIHERRGCNILFADMHVDFVGLKNLKELRWKIEGEEVFPPDLFSVDNSKILIKNISLMVLGLFVLTAAVVILCEYWTRKIFLFSLILGLISSGVGCFFGFLSESVLYLTNDDSGVGIIAGGVLGFVVAICYAPVLTKTSNSIKRQEEFKGYAISLGMATGVICSTILHLFLMITYEEIKPFGMIAGLPFGILAGSILGAISAIAAFPIKLETINATA